MAAITAQYEKQPGQPGSSRQPGPSGEFAPSPPSVPPTAAQPEKKKKGGCFKWGGIAAVVVVVLAAIAGVGDRNDSTDPMRLNATGSGSESSFSQSEASEGTEPPAPLASGSLDNVGATGQSDDTDVPVEYTNALRKAKVYADVMHMSKAGIYDQLTSEYGERFSAEAAQYAMDNLEADWNANALKKAQSYQDTMAMSPDAIYDQLVSDYGERFTPEEAQYAVDNL